MFNKPEWVDVITSKRRFETVDIVKRLGVISSERINMKNYPERRPAKAFNPAFIYDAEDGIIRLFVRIIPGYYMYVSLIARLDIEINDLFAGYVSFTHYPAEIIIGPDTKYDFWGAEDPRVQRVGDRWLMVYSGRTKWYMTLFTDIGRLNRVLPVIAASEEGIRHWEKIGVLVMRGEVSKYLESDKDVAILQGKYGIYVLHRPHLTDNRYFTLIGKVSEEILTKRAFQEYEITNNYIAIDIASFELKNGWSTNVISIGKDEYITLAHSVDRDMGVYRVFGVLLREEKDGLKVVSVTPFFIMQPLELYEKFGDRPMTVFPCGIEKIDDSILMTYGASDSFVGFGLIDFSELMSILDKYRID